MEYLVRFFAWIMDLCYQVVPNHWADILIFTLITKVLQYPLSIWCHVNSLKMVSIMPQSIRIKIDHFGDSEKIGEETAALFKREHYHPMLSLIPLAIQIVILMGFVKVIYGIAGTTPGTVAAFDPNAPMIARIPVQHGGVAWIMPLMAGAAAWFLGWCQNRINPLQHEQTRAQQMTTNGISIAISLFLGCFVGMGVGLYWAASNVFSILVQLCCNVTIRPSSRIDYPALYRAKAELQKLEDSVKTVVSKEDLRREKADYKRFFKVANKHLVFYAEGGGYYKYFQPVVEWLLAHTNIVIHYVTNAPGDPIFRHAAAQGEKPRIRPYYIGPMKIIPLMMKMDADMVVMTTPDLNTYQIKRSYVRKDVEYVYLCHGPTSMHMGMRKGAYDHFDTIFASGPFMVKEIRATEKLYGLKAKNIVETGYVFFETLFKQYAAAPKTEKGELPRILIAPSHQEDNLLDSCIDDLLGSICAPDRLVVVRPHPQYIRRNPAKIQALLERWKDRTGANLQFETDFSSNSSIYNSDILVTDWSSIAYEFSFATKRPCLFVNTKMKVLNPEYMKIGLEPTDIWFRDRVGVSVAKTEMAKAAIAIRDMLANPDRFAAEISKLLEENYFNPGRSGEVAGKYILDSLIKRKKGTRQ